MAMRKNPDLTHGPLWGKILLFALPVAATGILQQLFNAADVAILGRFVGKEAMAAVGSCSPVFGLLVGAFQGIAMGGNVVIANLTGRGDMKRIGGAVDTAVVLALICGVSVFALGELAAAPFLRLISVPEEIIASSLIYLRIYLIGMPVILLYNFEAAIYRSQGDGTTPLIILACSGFLKVGLSLFFVLGMGWGVVSVAISTVVANCFSATVLFILLHRTKLPIRMEWTRPALDGASARRILQIGIPAGIQSAMFSIANLTIQSAINSLGPDVIAGNAAAVNIEIFLFFLVNSFSQSATTFISQNYGAGDLSRCRRTARICLVQNAFFTVVVSLTLFHFGEYLLAIFNSDPVIIEYGMERMAVCLLFQPLNMFHDQLAGFMRGYGNSLVPAILTIFGVVGVRIFWIKFIFPAVGTLGYALRCFPISWIITGTAMAIAYFITLKRVYRREEAKKAAS